MYGVTGHGNHCRTVRCLSPPGGTQRNLFDTTKKERANITWGAFLPGEAGREKKERREQEAGRKEKVRCQDEAERQEEERHEEKESEDLGEPGRHKAGANLESWEAAARNGESGKANHIPGGRWLFQVRDPLRNQLSELVGKAGMGREEGWGSGNQGHKEASTGHSPFELFFGRQPQTLLDVAEEQWEETEEESRDILTYTRKLKENLHNVWEDVRSHVEESQERQKK
ncbi:hypothetical protein NDU88_004644 [Pleurodeles waltl]|uniref:Uncharacterized protein n=1 Tax=Pleurodeles waltl TaxID=8319 RepID=A0AAV7TRV1_PLEWA|nr:hypothetical protein NDU88_004644 [Pleurodeles waltl]